MQNDKLSSIFGYGNYYNDYMHYEFIKSAIFAVHEKIVICRLNAQKAIHWVVHLGGMGRTGVHVRSLRLHD